MNNLDDLLDRVYDINHYNCVHYAVEVWQVLFKEDISAKFDGVAQQFNTAKRVKKSSMQLFKEIEKPKDDTPCIVCFQKSYTAPHVGVFFRGCVLHLTEAGAQNIELHKIEPVFERVSFYA